MGLRRCWVLVAIVLCLGLACTRRPLRATVDSYAATYTARRDEMQAPLSGILVVAVHGGPVLIRTYGTADREKGTPITMSTRFGIGSLTKQFTAAATLKLAEAGCLDLEASVRRYMPELPSSYEKIAITHLLQQTSGIPSYTDSPMFGHRSADNFPPSEMLDWFVEQTPNFAAGSRFKYSNSNYYLLALLVERVANEPFESYLARAILKPAGMKATSSASGADDAMGYRRGDDNTLEADPRGSTSASFGAGFLLSSAQDLLAWDRALVGTKVLSSAAKKKMWNVGHENYAMGWVIESDLTEIQWHNGKINGFGSFFARIPDYDMAIVLLSNMADFDTTAAGLMVVEMALGGQPKEPPPERPAVAVDEPFAHSVVGNYVLTAESKARLNKVGAQHLADSVKGFAISWVAGQNYFTGKPSGQRPFALRRSAAGSLFHSLLGVELTFDFGAQHAATTALGMTLKQGSLTLRYVRGEPATRP